MSGHDRSLQELSAYHALKETLRRSLSGRPDGQQSPVPNIPDHPSLPATAPRWMHEALGRREEAERPKRPKVELPPSPIGPPSRYIPEAVAAELALQKAAEEQPRHGKARSVPRQRRVGPSQARSALEAAMTQPSRAEWAPQEQAEYDASLGEVAAAMSDADLVAWLRDRFGCVLSLNEKGCLKAENATAVPRPVRDEVHRRQKSLAALLKR